MNKSRLIIVDGFLIVRTGLSLLINANEKFEAKAIAYDEKYFYRLLKDYSPNLVIMDVDNPAINGIEITRKALKIKPDLKIIALSTCEDEKYVEKFMYAGVKGFILKNVGIEELYNAIDMVSKGEIYLAQDMMNIFAKRFYTQKPNKIRKFFLSRREKEILKLLCQSYSTTEIARKFGLSPRTIEGHRSQLLKKTNTKNTRNLVLYAMKYHYYTIPVE